MFRFATRKLVSSSQSMHLEQLYNCQNYKPLPVVISKGLGTLVWDCEGKQYIDCMAGISSLNQGHLHPRIKKALINQLDNLTTIARVYHHDRYGLFCEYINKTFGYDRSYFGQGGIDANEAAILMARRWAYNVKGVPDGKAKILFPSKTFWGRSIAGRAGSDDPYRQDKFGPFGGLEFQLVEYNNISKFEEALKADKNICAYLVEPIQGEAGIVVPTEGYLTKIRELCTKYNVLLIADEIQTGLGRTGKFMAKDYDPEAKPDMVILGKSISGGFLPFSAVLGNNNVFDQIKPGEMGIKIQTTLQGSTYQGYALGCAVCQEAIQVIIDEDLAGNSKRMGELFMEGIKHHKKSRFVKDIRGKGFFVALEFGNEAKPGMGWDFALKLAEHGVLVRPGGKDMIVRFIPPLVITKEQTLQVVEAVNKAFAFFEKN